MEIAKDRTGSKIEGYYTLLAKCLRISLHLTDDAIAKLSVTKSLVE